MTSKSLQQLVADKIIEYPLDILEYIVEKGYERIRKENKRQVIVEIYFKILMALLDYNENKEYKLMKEHYLEFLNFCIDMKINEYDARFQFLIDEANLQVINLYHLKNSLEKDLIFIESMPYEDLLEILYHFRLAHTDPKRNKTLIDLLYEYPMYTKYFKIVDCYKYNYVCLFIDQSNYEYTGHEIGENINKMEITDYAGVRNSSLISTLTCIFQVI